MSIIVIVPNPVSQSPPLLYRQVLALRHHSRWVEVKAARSRLSLVAISTSFAADLRSSSTTLDSKTPTVAILAALQLQPLTHRTTASFKSGGSLHSLCEHQYCDFLSFTSVSAGHKADDQCLGPHARYIKGSIDAVATSSLLREYPQVRDACDC